VNSFPPLPKVGEDRGEGEDEPENKGGLARISRSMENARYSRKSPAAMTLAIFAAPWFVFVENTGV